MEVQIQTDVGLRRKQNEDFASRFVNQNGALLVVLADGMGGHKAGDVASRFVVNQLGLSFSKTNFKENKQDKIKNWFEDKLIKLNEEVVSKGQAKEEFKGMGTTIVLAYFDMNNCLIAHVGDSRAYLYRKNELKLLTEDHSFAYELYKQGEITKEMAENHPEKNSLTRAIGVPFEIEIDYSWQKLVENDIYLLCSDGLTNMVSEEKITDILSTNLSLESKASLLIEEAKIAGGFDNITVALIKEENEVR